MSYSNEIFDLLEAVKITDKITDEEWKKGLSDRKIKEIESSIMPQKPYVSKVGDLWIVQDYTGEEVMSTQDKNKALYFFDTYYDMLSGELDECPSPGPKKDFDPGPKDPYRWIRELVPSHWNMSGGKG